MLLRRRLIAIAGGTAVAGLPHRPAHADGKQTLRLGHILGADSQIGAGAAAMADAVASQSGGRFAIQLFPNAALGDELSMVQAVQRGALDLALITGAPLPTILPEVGVFNIPFLFDGPDHARAVLDGPIGDEYRQRFAIRDLVALAWGENGMRHITNSRHPITTPDSLRDIRLRVPQSDVMLLAFKTMGANPAPLPFPQVMDALRLGTFDGQENPIGTIRAAGFYRVQKHLTLTAHVYDPALMLMAPLLFDALPSADRSLFIAAARVGGQASRSAATAAQENGIEPLRASGMLVVTAIDRSLFVTALAPAIPAFEALFGRDEIERIRRAG